MSIITKLTWINDSINIGEQIIYVRHDDEERFIAGRVGASGRLYLDDLTDLEPRPDEATYQVSSVLELNTGETIEKISDELTLEVPPAIPDVVSSMLYHQGFPVNGGYVAYAELKYDYRFTSSRSQTRFKPELFSLTIDGKTYDAEVLIELVDGVANFVFKDVKIDVMDQPIAPVNIITYTVSYDGIELLTTEQDIRPVARMDFTVADTLGTVIGSYGTAGVKPIFLERNGDSNRNPYDSYASNLAGNSEMAYTEGGEYSVIVRTDGVLTRHWSLSGKGLADVTAIVSNQRIFAGVRFYNQNTMSIMSTDLFKISLPELPWWFTSTNGMFAFSYIKEHNVKVTSAITNMGSMFYRNLNGWNGDMSDWDTSNVTDMSYFMASSNTMSGIGMGNWDTRKVTTMQYMCYNNSAVIPEGEDSLAGIANWETPELTTLKYAFSTTSKAPDISNWQVPKLTDISYMCQGNPVFNHPIGKWLTPELTELQYAFSKATAFNQDLPNWDVSKVTKFGYLFNEATNFNGNISNWDTSNATDMSYMFYKCGVYNQPMNDWDVRKVKTFTAFLLNGFAFNQPLDKWCPVSATTMTTMFAYITDFTQDISTWCVPLITARPNNFSARTDKLELDPFWGTCPLRDDLGEGYSFKGNAGSYTITSTAEFEIYANGELIDTRDFTLTEPATITITRIVADGARLKITGGITEWFRYPENEHGIYNIYFYDCAQLVKVPDQIPPYLTSLADCFSYCTNFNYDISGWDTSNVTNMRYMFGRASSFNQNIENWDTSKVTDMSYMFFYTLAFNQPIDKWDTSNVTNIGSMFESSTAFNQPLNSWNTGKVERFSNVFLSASAFNQPLGDWDVSSGRYFRYMFRRSLFNHPIGNWDMGSATDITGMFASNVNFDQDIRDWNTSNVTSMDYLFQSSVFNHPIGNWDVSKVTTLAGVFQNNVVFNQNINNWNVSKVTTIESIFLNAAAYNQSMHSWNVGNVTNMTSAFSGAISFNKSLYNWNVGKVVSFHAMFKDVTNFNSSLEKWDVRAATDMANMFRGNTYLWWIGTNQWCVSKILKRPNDFSDSERHDEPFWGTCPTNVYDSSSTVILHAENTPLKIICGPNDTVRLNDTVIETTQVDGEHYEANINREAGRVYVTHGDADSERTLTFISDGIVEVNDYHAYQGNVIGFRFNSVTEDLYPLRHLMLQVPDYVTSTAYMFKGLTKLDPEYSLEIDFYLLNKVTTTEGMFYGCKSLKYCMPSFVGTVVNTSYMYYGCSSLVDGDDQSGTHAVNTDHMFDGCIQVTSDILSSYTLKNVKTARYMFRGCEALTTLPRRTEINNCEDMTGMFEGCISLNDSAISNLNVAKVRSFKDTFKGCVKLNQPLSNWDVSSAEIMDGMFHNATLFNHDLTGWCVKYVMSEPPNFGTNSVLPEKYYPMWGSCPINGYLPIKFDFSVTPGIEYTLTVSSGIEMIDWGDGTITRLTDLITPHTHTYTTSGVYRVTMHPTDNALVSFSQEGGNMTMLTPLPILNVVQWGTANWGKAEIGNSLLNSVPYTQPPFKNYDRMFKGSTVFNQNIEHWDMTIGVSVIEMFANCTAYNSSLAGWDVSRITDFRYLFSGCTSFNQPLADWDVESATDMEGMFYACATYNRDLSGWCVTNILSEPGNFRTNGVLSDDNTPIWGSCPSKYGLPMIVVKNVTTRLTNTVPLQQNAINMIDWGDGNISYSDGLNPIEYTYASAGIYTVKIYARLGNKLYIDGGMLVDVQEVVQWCSEGNSYIYFGSDLLTKVPNKAPPKTTSYYDLFRNCSIFNQNINDWDTSGVNNMNGVFRNASSFNQPLDKWDTSKVTNLSSVFTGATAFNQNINTWNTSKAMTLVQIFSDAMNFNQPLNNWDVGQVTSLSSAFYNAAKFNQPLDKWDTGKVVDMGGTFRNAVAFNQNINTWNVENVSSFLTMFAGAAAFDQPLNNWKTPNATSVRAMFSGATAFNHDISNFDVSKCTDFTNVLYGCTYFNHPMNDWDMSSAKTLSNMFYGCASFDQPLDKWDLSSCTHLDYMFSLSAFNHPIDMWDVTQVTNFRAMFEKNVVFDKPLANWDVISATNMISMFNGATAFDSSLAIWCVTGIISRPSNFSNMVESKEPVWGTCPKRVDMFTATLNIDTVNTVVSFADGAVVGIIDWGDGQQTNVGVTTHTYISRGTFTVTIHPVEGSKLAISKLSGSEWISVVRWGESAFSAIHLESSKLTSVPDVAPDLENFSGMFRRCTSFNDVAVTKWDMSKAVYTNDMFEECALFDQDISGWDMSNVVNVNGMFRGCTGFKQVLASWRLTSVTTCTYMFERAVTTCNLDMSQWGLTNTTTAKGMFLNSGLVDNGISTCGIGLKCTDLSSTFEGCAKFVGDVSNWEVVNVTDMTKLFKGCTLFNVDIGKWDVEGCLAMDYMFQSTTVFNQDLSTWCVIHILTQPTGFRLSSALKDSFTPIWGTCPLKADPLVVKLNTSSKKEFTIVANSNLVAVTVSGVGSFYPAKANALITFTIPDDMDSVNVFMYPEVNTQINLPYGSANQLPITEVIQWPSNGFVVAYLGNPELTKVPDFPPPNTTSLAHLFRNASSFVQDVTGWDVSKVTSFSYMFSGCSLFNQAVGSWTTTNCTDTSYMFQNCPLFNQPLASWNMAKVITTTYMFQNCKVFNQPIGGWNMAKNKSLAFMFNGCSAFNQPLNTWNVSAVTHFGSIFKDAVAFDQPLDKWNTVSALVASSTFSGATAFNQDISGWNMSKTTNFGNMFEYAVNFNQPIGKWSVMSAIGMGYMFRGATKFSQDLSSWCVTKFTDAPSGFSVNSGLTDAQLPVWGTCPNGV